MAQLLEAVPGSPNTIAVIRQCLGDLLKIGEQEPTLAREAARWIEATAIEGGLPDSEFGHEPMALADAFALAEQILSALSSWPERGCWPFCENRRAVRHNRPVHLTAPGRARACPSRSMAS
jgi:hypothetical protein